MDFLFATISDSKSVVYNVNYFLVAIKNLKLFAKIIALRFLKI